MSFKKTGRYMASFAVLASAMSVSAIAETTDYERQITFGDSLSDGGRYAAFVPTGGKFTTNPDPVWVEVLADDLGLESSSIAVGGLNFAEGGARVTTPQPIPPFTQLEISTQIQNFLAAGGTFGPNDLVTIQGGGNDLFALQDGRATVDEFLQAAVDLAGLTQSIVDAGAGTVMVGNLQLTDPFNFVFESTLAAQGTNALFLDVDALFVEILTDPGAFGFTNVTDTACIGSSLTCTPADFVEPGANLTYALADDVHPGGRLQDIQGNMAAHLVRAPTQIGQLSYAAENILLHAQNLASEQIRGGGEVDEGLSAFGGLSYANFEIDGGVQRAGLSQDAIVFSAGYDLQVTEKIGLGAVVSYVEGEADFDGVGGGFDNSGFMATAYYRGKSGDLRWGAQANLGALGFDDITREVQLGTLLRANSGDTEGEIFSIAAEFGYDAAHASWFVGPVAGAAFTDITVKSYGDGTNSTAARFSDQDLETLRVFAGLEIAGSDEGSIQPYVRAVYSFDGKDDDRTITITPAGAPISYTGDALTLDGTFFDVRAGLNAPLGEKLNISVSAGGIFGRDDADAYDASVKVALPF